MFEILEFWTSGAALTDMGGTLLPVAEDSEWVAEKERGQGQEI